MSSGSLCITAGRKRGYEGGGEAEEERKEEKEEEKEKEEKEEEKENKKGIVRSAPCGSDKYKDIDRKR